MKTKWGSFSIENRIVHPCYTPGQYRTDIGLLKISPNNRTTVKSLLDARASINPKFPPTNTAFFFYGFGRIAKGAEPHTSWTQLAVNLKPRIECKQNFPKYNHKWMICGVNDSWPSCKRPRHVR